MIGQSDRYQNRDICFRGVRKKKDLLVSGR